MKGARKSRVDQLIVERGLAESREKAQRLILAGQVMVGGKRAEKSGQLISEKESIEVLEPLKYVSRGGFKLEKALDDFGIDVTNKVVIDAGASTGGFTDCLIQRNARLIYAIDVGYGQIAWKLREDPRVVVMDRTNARNLTPDMFASPVDLAVMDVSFIGAHKILEPLLAIVPEVVLLLKPQFEAGPHDVPRGGVIRDPAVHLSVLKNFFSHKDGWDIVGLIDSPISGGSGNREFLVHLKRTEGEKQGWTEDQFIRKASELIK